MSPLLWILLALVLYTSLIAILFMLHDKVYSPLSFGSYYMKVLMNTTLRPLSYSIADSLGVTHVAAILDPKNYPTLSEIYGREKVVAVEGLTFNPKATASAIKFPSTSELSISPLTPAPSESLPKLAERERLIRPGPPVRTTQLDDMITSSRMDNDEHYSNFPLTTDGSGGIPLRGVIMDPLKSSQELKRVQSAMFFDSNVDSLDMNDIGEAL